MNTGRATLGLVLVALTACASVPESSAGARCPSLEVLSIEPVPQTGSPEDPQIVARLSYCIANFTENTYHISPQFDMTGKPGRTSNGRGTKEPYPFLTTASGELTITTSIAGLASDPDFVHPLRVRYFLHHRYGKKNRSDVRATTKAYTIAVEKTAPDPSSTP